MGRRARNGTTTDIEPGIIAGARRRIGQCVLLGAAFAALCTPARGQSGTGTIHGIVVEQAAGALGGASVVVVNVDTGIERRTRTDVEGAFTVAALSAGRYEITASLDGFAAQRQEGIEIRAGDAIRSRLELRRAVLAETLSLAQPVTTLDPLRTAVAASIARPEIELLPVSSRNVVDLALLAPGVTAAGPARTISAGGMSGTQARLVVDGTEPIGSSDGTFAARAAYELPADAVDDVQITVNAPPAAYGNAAGAILSVATRSGGNLFTGRIAERYRGSALQGSPVSTPDTGFPEHPARSHQFGATFGGPLMRDRHFLFAAYDGLRSRDENRVLLNIPAQTEGLATAGAAALATSAASWPRALDQDLLMVRTDHRLGDATRVTLRYQQVRVSGVNTSAEGPRIALERSGATRDRGHEGAVRVGNVMTPTIFNDIRVLYARRSALDSINGAQPQADVSELGALALSIGQNAAGPQDRTLTRYQATDTLSWSSGRHLFQGGFDVRLDRAREAFAAGLGGAYWFGSLASYASGVPSAGNGSYTQAFLSDGSSSLTIRPDTDTYALFVQDTWRVHERVTVDAGVRYDVQRFTPAPRAVEDPALAAAGIDPGAVRLDGNNWGPRVGIAWALSGRYVARAGYGIRYGRAPNGLLAATHAYNGIDVRTLVLTGGDGSLPSYPARVTAAPAAARPTIVAFDRTFDTPRVQEASAGLEWQWMPHTLLAFTYLHARGADLPLARDVNVGAAVPTALTLADGGDVLPYLRFTPGPFPEFDRVVLVGSGGASAYDGVTIEMRRRLAQGMQYRLAYTRATATDRASVPDALVPYGASDRLMAPAGALDYTAGDADQRHRFVASTIMFSDTFAARFHHVLKTVLDDWQVGAIYTIEEGLPYSAYVDADLNGNGNRFDDIAPGTVRNAYRMKKAGRLDARLTRVINLGGGIRATAVFDVFNVFKAAHARSVDQTLYSVAGTTLVRNPQFGNGFNPRDPRVLQLGLMFGF